MKLIDLHEAKEKNLIGAKISGQPITDPWHGFFECNQMGLTSLKGAPKTVNGYFDCGGNNLMSLEWAPTIIHGYFSCVNNKLTSLKDIHKIIKEMNGTFYTKASQPPRPEDGNHIVSSVLGLLYIKGCKLVGINNLEVEEILNKYLEMPYSHKRVFECQCALQDADLDEYAQL